MATEVAILGGADQADATEQTATRIPAGVARLAGVGNDLDQVVLAVFQFVAQVDLEAYVAVVRAADALTVEQHVSRVHNAAEIDQHALALQVGGWGQVVAVVALAHLLEAAAGEAALDIGRHVGVVGLLVSGWCHPRLFYLEVVRQVDVPPLALVVQTKFPSKVQTLRRALGRC